MEKKKETVFEIATRIFAKNKKAMDILSKQ